MYKLSSYMGCFPTYVTQKNRNTSPTRVKQIIEYWEETETVFSQTATKKEKKASGTGIFGGHPKLVQPLIA